MKAVACIHISCQDLVLVLIKHPRYWCLSQRKKNDQDLDSGELSVVLEGTDCTNCTNRHVFSARSIPEERSYWLDGLVGQIS